MNLRRVMLDPDGTAGSSWMYVIVVAPTGVVYEQQYGGTATLLGAVEGYLVPVHDPVVLAALRAVFERGVHGRGVSGGPLPETLLDEVLRAVAQIRYWQHADGDDEVGQLVVDAGRLPELDEAWVPVSTPDGPGYLVWSNSD